MARSKRYNYQLRGKTIEPGMDVDFQFGVFYVGLGLPHEPESGHQVLMYLSSEGDLLTYDAEENLLITDENIAVKAAQPFELLALHGGEPRMSAGALLDFKSDIRPPLASLHLELVAALKSYVQLPKLTDYDLVAVWIAGTYLYKVFPNYPSLLLTSKLPGAGKTRLLSVLDRLCFNAYRFSGFTESALVRTANSSACTILLDEAEILGRDKAKEGKIIELLNSRFDADTSYWMSSPLRSGEWATRPFYLFGPTVIAKLERGGVPDTLASRSIELKMLPLSEGQEHIQFSHPKYDNRWSPLRDKLYVWALDRWNRVLDTYLNDDIVRVGSNRTLDISRLLLSIGKHLPGTPFDELVTTVARLNQEEPSIPPDGSTPIQDFIKTQAANGVSALRLDQVASDLRDQLPPRLKKGGKALAKELRSLGATVRKGAQGFTWVYFDI